MFLNETGSLLLRINKISGKKKDNGNLNLYNNRSSTVKVRYRFRKHP